MKRTPHSKSVLAVAGTLIFLFAFSFASSAQSSDKRIKVIKKIVDETNRVVEIADSDEYSSVFIVEVNVNQKGNPYPAVGTYRSTAKFYYTYGDREKNPYPDRLLKIAVVTHRASMIEKTAIFLNPASEMILYMKVVEGDERSDRRLYFGAGKVIRFESGGKVIRLGDREILSFMKAAIADKIRLIKIFQAALD